MEQLDLDDSQRRAIKTATGATATVITGASGTGKTTVLLEAASHIIEAGQSLVLLAAGRKAADDLRSKLTLRHGRLPHNVSVRTAQAWAFGILQEYAADRGRQTPELITGPGQDAIITELLAEIGDQIPWPEAITPDVIALPGFRAELRDLLTRAAELGLSGADLVQLGTDRSEENWIAVGHLMDHYENALALEDATAPGGAGADRFDHARLVHQAARLLATPDAWSQGAMPTWDWVLVDDYQNATLATASLLSSVHDIIPGDGRGARLVMTADPDTAVEGFRGGIAHLPGLARGSKPGLGVNAGLVTLEKRHRAGAKLAALQDSLIARIGVAGTGEHRKPEAADGEDAFSITTFPGGDQQLSGIARMIRREHVRGNLRYDDIAIITRSRGAHTEIERVLREAGVRVRPAARNQPLRYSRVVRALMDIIREAGGGELADADLLGLLSSPVIGLEPSHRRTLVQHVNAAFGESETPVRDALVEPPKEDWAQPLRRLSHILDKARVAIASGLDAEAVLWEAWETVGLAEDWRERALSGGPTSRSSGAMLDSVMQMFRVAQRMVDRDARTTAAQLIDELEGQDIAEDSIARTGRESGVHLLTPAMAIGQDFELVIVADLNDGAWPNLRIRDGLFGAGRLAELHLDRLTDGISGLRSVLDDELRMLAFSIGRARKELVFTAVDSEDTSHSRFIDLIATEADIEHIESSQLSMSIPGVIGRLRSAISDPTLRVRDSDRELAADILASLPTWSPSDRIGVAPETWIPTLEPSNPEPWEASTRISPSSVENILKCTLKWFMESAGLKNVEDVLALSRGTFVHELAEKHPDGDLQAMMESVEAMWDDYAADLADGYEREFEREIVLFQVETLSNYLREHPKGIVERTVRVETDSFTVAGRIDRIEETPDGPVIVDFKTGKPKSKTLAQENPQLKVYQWLYEKETGQATAGAKLVHVSEADKSGLPKTREQDPLTDEGRAQVDEMLIEVKNELGGVDLGARENDACRYCSAKVVCPLYEEGALFS